MTTRENYLSDQLGQAVTDGDVQKVRELLDLLIKNNVCEAHFPKLRNAANMARHWLTTRAKK